MLNNILELFQKINESNNSQVQQLSDLSTQIMSITSNNNKILTDDKIKHNFFLSEDRLGNIEDKHKNKIEKLKNRVAILESN